jgi:hypothetical protein
MIRYDTAGLLVGLAVSDRIRGDSRRLIFARTGATLVPLAIWLTLTALRWDTGGRDHYLQQMVQKPVFDLLWSVRVILDVIFDPQRLILPVWISMDEAPLRSIARATLFALGLLGAAIVVRRRAPGAVTAVGLVAGYILVHAVFPFQWPRFGYPPAPIGLLWIGAGLVTVWNWAAAGPVGPSLRVLASVVLGVFGLILLAGEWSALPPWNALTANAWVLLTAVTGAALLFVAMEPLLSRRQVMQFACATLIVLFARVQLREGLPALGTGRERENLVEAARWIAQHARPGDGILSDIPGLLRLYCPDHTLRFPAFIDIQAEAWPEILVECDRRGIAYVVWHDAIYSDLAHAEYGPAWRLDRFAQLDQPASAPGFRVLWSQAGQPNVWILKRSTSE